MTHNYKEYVASFTEPSAIIYTEVHPITIHSVFLKFTRALFTK